MSQTFQLKHPLPSRRAAEGLRQQIIEHLVQTQPEIGAPFLSDHQLARVAGLSRPTVRRALDSLSREGWIERRHGRGTYVGPRAAIGTGSTQVGLTSAAASGDRKGVVRMAVLVHGLGDFSHDWYSPSVLAGIDEVAGEERVTIELVGDRHCDVRAVSNRLMQSRPDVLACLAPAARHALLIGEAQRQGIPAIGTGSFLTDLGIPTVCEEGRAGAAEAVRYLASKGHRRIGFVQMAFGLPMVFQRHRGYLEGLESVGIEADESLVLWLRRGEPEGSEAKRLSEYLKRCRPTAIVCGVCWPLKFMSELVRRGEVRVPGDVSVVTFDQHPGVEGWLGGVTPAVVALPLREMGRELARLGRRAAGSGEVPKVTYVACRLEEGESVRDLRENSGGWSERKRS